MSVAIEELLAAVAVAHIEKTFTVNGAALPVLADVTFDGREHRITAIVGPSNCGKSTLVDLIAGFERPTSGAVSIHGSKVNGPGIDRLVVFQENALFPWLSVLENVTFGPIATGSLSPVRARTEAEAMLEQMGLRDVSESYPHQLSGGMQRRVELARALVNRPAVLLLDEPFRGLDALTRRIMQRYFLSLHDADPRTTIVVTSELDEAVLLADDIVILSHAPARVQDVIPVNLPRPRPPNIFETAAYRAVLGSVITSFEGQR